MSWAEAYQERERKVLEFTAQHWREFSTGPSFEEIRNMLGLRSKASVETLILRMRDRGVVTFRYGKHRDLRPTGRCPCCGRAE